MSVTPLLAPPDYSIGALTGQGPWTLMPDSDGDLFLGDAAGVRMWVPAGGAGLHGNEASLSGYDLSAGGTLGFNFILRTSTNNADEFTVGILTSDRTYIAKLQLLSNSTPDSLYVTISDSADYQIYTVAVTASTSIWRSATLRANGSTIIAEIEGTPVGTLTAGGTATLADAAILRVLINQPGDTLAFRGSSLTLTDASASLGTITNTGTVTAAQAATGTFTLDGPYSGTVTLADNVTGSTFVHGTVTNASLGTFTLTPTVGGTHTLSGTGNPALTLDSGTLIVWGPLVVSVARSGADAIVTFSYVGADTFSVSVDGGAYSVQTSPYTATGMGTGSHTFTVRAFGGPVTNLLASEPFTYTDDTIVSGLHSGADWQTSATSFDDANGASVPNAVWVKGNTAVCNVAAIGASVKVAAYWKTAVKIGAAYIVKADAYLDGTNAVDAQLHFRNPLTTASQVTYLLLNKSAVSFQGQSGAIGSAVTGLGLADGFHAMEVRVTGNTLEAYVDGVLKQTITSSLNSANGGVGFKFRKFRTTSAQGLKNFLLYDNFLAEGSAALAAGGSDDDDLLVLGVL